MWEEKEKRESRDEVGERLRCGRVAEWSSSEWHDE